MTIRPAQLLRHLAEHPGSTRAELISALDASRHTVSVLLAQGVAWGRVLVVPGRCGGRRRGGRLPHRYYVAPSLADRLAPMLDVEADDDTIVEEVDYLVRHHDQHSGAA